MTTQDFTKGVDLTGVTPINPADFNNLVDLATPTKDTGEEVGKGLLITTTDTALNTPSVPDASVNVKWKRYIWIRRPFAGAVDKKSIAYGWNDDATSVTTYLKWIRIDPDLTTLSADVLTALTNSTNATTAVALLNTAVNAGVATANTAYNTANTATANALQAQTDANTAITTADSAVVTSDAALATVNTTRTPAVVLTPGLPGQNIRTNAAGLSVEWFYQKNNYVRITESHIKGTGAGQLLVNPQVRLVNTINNNDGALVALNPSTSIITFSVAGTYRVRTKSQYHIVWAGSTGYTCIQTILKKFTGGTILLSGEAARCDTLTGVGIALPFNSLEVNGTITVAVGDDLALYDYFAVSNVAAYCGRTANVHPDAGGVEIFTTIELWLLNY